MVKSDELFLSTQEAPVADFQEIKAKVSIEQAAQMLGLAMRVNNAQLRGACPACESGGDRALVITPSKQLFYCFSAGIGGDLISLVGHMKKCSLAESGRHISDHFGIGNSGTGARVHKSSSSSEPPARKGQDKEGALQPLTYLEHDHPAVTAVGFDPATAKALGIGFAPKGIMRGTVAVPLRDADGNLTGYIGVTEARLPSSFRVGGVVALKTA